MSIWSFADRMLPELPSAARLSMGEGHTPLVRAARLADEIGLENLWLKREDLNPSGSHKDRGIAFQLSTLRHRDPELSMVVISSSGNAAIAAASYGSLAGLRVVTCLSPSTSETKLQRLRSLRAIVIPSNRPVALAKSLASTLDIPNLRPSSDELSVEGFKTIGWELSEEFARIQASDTSIASASPVGSAQAIFSFASSGSSFVGIARALYPSEESGREAISSKNQLQPELHAVQGMGASPIAAHFDLARKDGELGDLGRLGAKKTRRMGEAVRAIRRSGGHAWAISDAEAKEAADLFLGNGIEAAFEAAGALAAIRRAAKERDLRSAILILTGRAAQLCPQISPAALDESGLSSPVPCIDDVDEALDFISRQNGSNP